MDALKPQSLPSSPQKTDRRVSRLFEVGLFQKHKQTELQQSNSTQNNQEIKLNLKSGTTTTTKPGTADTLISKKEKQATKLAANLDQLSKASQSLSEGLKKQQEDMQAKQIQVQLKQEQANMQMQGKLSTFVNEKNGIQKELEEKKSKLKEVEEKTIKHKQELLSMKQLKEKMLVELKDESDETLRLKLQNIQALSTDVEQLKVSIKETRTVRREWEENLENLEEERIGLGLMLNDLGKQTEHMKELQHTNADFEVEVMNQQRLKQKLQELQALKAQTAQKNAQLQNQLTLISSQRDELLEHVEYPDNRRDLLQSQLENLKHNNKTMFDKNLELLDKLKGLQVEVQTEESKRVGLVEIANLLKDQNRFERQSRKLQARMENVEDTQRTKEDASKEIQSNLKQLALETEVSNEQLEKQVQTFREALQKSVEDSDVLEEEVRSVMSKVCNKPPEQLKIDQIDANYAKLISFEGQIQKTEVRSNELDRQLEALRHSYKDFESKLKQKYFSDASSYLDDNDVLISKTNERLWTINDKMSKLESVLRDKSAQTDEQMSALEKVRTQIALAKTQSKYVRTEMDSEKVIIVELKDHQDFNKGLMTPVVTEKASSVSQQSNIGEFVVQYKDSKDQNERLKALQQKEIPEIEDMLQDISDDVSKLEEGLMGDKIQQCQNMLDQGKDLSSQLDQSLKDLQARLNSLEDDLKKADRGDAKDIQNEIDRVRRDLDAIKGSKDNLMKNLNNIGKKKGEDLLDHQKELKGIIDQLENLQNKDLKTKEQEVDDIENKLKQAIRKLRNAKRNGCQEAYDKAKCNLDHFKDLVDQIQQKIDAINKDAARIQKSYAYKDLERTNEIDDKLNKKLFIAKDTAQELQAQKDELQDQVEALTKDIDDITQNLISHQQNKDKQGDNPNEDPIVQKWEQCCNKINKTNDAISKQVKKAEETSEGLDTLKQVSAELQDKYKSKHGLFDECRKKQNEKQEIINGFTNTFNKVNKNLQLVKVQLEGLVAPDTPEGHSFVKDSNDKIKDLNLILEKYNKERDKKLQLQAKLDSICACLEEIGDNVVTIKQLQEVRDELDRLELDLNHQHEEMKDLEKECADIMYAVKKLSEDNKELKEKEADTKLRELQTRLGDMDQLQKDTEGKLNEYKRLIKEGLCSDDDDIKAQMQQLMNEAAALEKSLKQIERNKNNIKAAEKSLRERLNDYKMNPNKSIDHLDQLCQNISDVNGQSEVVHKNLEGVSKEIDGRLKDLNDYLNKFNELQGLFSDFDTMLGDFNKNYNKFLRRFKDIEDNSKLLGKILTEMEKGIPCDYKLKEGFIVQEQGELKAVIKTLEQLLQMRDVIDPKLKRIKKQGEQNLDNDNLQELITEVMGLIEDLEKSDHSASQCVSKLKKIKSDIGFADIPELVKVREQEVSEFSGKLRKVETDFQELKKVVAGSKGFENQKELEKDIKNMEQKLQVFREDRVTFKRILGQELVVFLPNPQILDDLKTLHSTIVKVRELGEALNKSIEMVDKLQMWTSKMKRQVGGLDMMKRHRELVVSETDQRGRLGEVKNRLQRIGKGAADCDGYTSNTEEATFIDTLLQELPEMLEKQKEALAYCDQIEDALGDVKQDIDRAAKNEGDEDLIQRVVSNLEEVEEQVGLNERTVVFLEKLADKLEDHFLQMDVKKKLDKRQLELHELENICKDFDHQTKEMHDHILKDLEKLEGKRKAGGLQDMMVDEEGNKVNLLEELLSVQEDLEGILMNVNELQITNSDIQNKVGEAQVDFHDNILRNSPYKSQSKITNKSDMFPLLKMNGWMKKKIIDMIKSLKEVSKRMKDNKNRYQAARAKLEKQNKPKRVYRAVKGDLVDELFADYINKLNCPVPINRLGNNQYTFGTRKIYAKVINGKLVIRVGGGYMGIEEFMMYYGNQELQRIQKQEFMHSEESINKSTYLDNGGLLSDYEDDDDDDEGRKSRAGRDSLIDIDRLSKRLRQQSAKKKKQANKSFFGNNEGEEEKDEGKQTVIGIGDVRKALKQNMFEIKTYQEHSSVSQYSTAQEVASRNKVHKGSLSKKMVTPSSNQVERQLRTMEKKVELKLKKGLAEKKSPVRSKLRTAGDTRGETLTTEDSQEQSDDQSIKGQPKVNFKSRIPQIKKTPQR